MSDSTMVLHDCLPGLEQFRIDVTLGLSRHPRTLPCKYFYDATGSQLFDKICELDEYYPTRTEMGIMRTNIPAMARLLGPNVRLVEFGSGSSLKTRLLLDAMPDIASYTPVDISRDHLRASAEALRTEYPGLAVQPVCADYTHTFDLPDPSRRVAKTVVFFPGSTIGNFHPEEAQAFLCRIAALAGHGGGLLIGFDLRKDIGILEAAYNDAQGVTAEFNLNLLRRINCELDADIDLSDWRHSAHYNRESGRIEMHLISLREQYVRIGSSVFKFGINESILTECSYKYTLDGFSKLAAHAGLHAVHTWMDPTSLFCVQFLSAD